MEKTVKFKVEKETKNTVKFEEVLRKDSPPSSGRSTCRSGSRGTPRNLK